MGLFYFGAFKTKKGFFLFIFCAIFLSILLLGNRKLAKDRAKVADGWAGAVLQHYKTTVQLYFTLTSLTMTYNTKQGH